MTTVTLNRELGFKLLGVYLIAAAIIQYVPNPLALLLPPLAIVAGVLLLIGR
jgi:hypothetical protein